MVEWKKRVITGLTVTPLVFLLTHYKLLFTVFGHVGVFLGWKEYRILVQATMKLHSSESEHQYINSLASSIKPVLAVHFLLAAGEYFNSESMVHVLLLLTIALLCLGRVLDFLNFLKIAMKKESLQQDPILDRKLFVLTFLQMGADTIGILLFIYPAIFILLINNSEGRVGYILLWFVAAWQTDNGCLFLGSLMGKTPFAPLISPKKTWEGISGGIFLSVFSCFVLSLFATETSTWIPHWPTKHYLIVALLIAVVSILGDYLESFMKRAANLKDSGSLLPGHGGILDRMDSLAITAPVIYFYSQFMLKN